MQLIDMLTRFSPAELTELRRRRQVRSDLEPRDMPHVLADRYSLLRAFAELNAFQHLLLQWLIQQPSQRASWSQIAGELRGRLSQESLETQVKDLRLWGLVDHSPDLNEGYLATFPAVAAALPSARLRIANYLSRIANPDILGRMYRCLGYPQAPAKKEVRIEVIASLLRQPPLVQEAVGRLSPHARDLFTWIRGEGGRVGGNEMRERAGGISVKRGSGWWDPLQSFFAKENEDNPLCELVRSCLALPVDRNGEYPGYYGDTHFAVPDEVEYALSRQSLLERGPVSPPKLVEARAAASPPDPMYLLRDLAHMAGFIASGRCAMRQDGEPYQRSLNAFGKMIGADDRDYCITLWRLVSWMGMDASSRGSTRKSGGLKNETGGSLMARVIEAWAMQGESPTHNDARGRLLTTLHLLPPDTWVTKSSVAAFMAYSWPMIFGSMARHGFDDLLSNLWRDARLLPIAQAVGVDGQKALMVPAALQQFLEDCSNSGDLLPPWSESWVVQPDRSIVAPPNLHPAAILDLWRVAELESNQGAAIFRLTRETVASALNRGMTPKQITALLAARSKSPLPATVEQIIGDQGKRYGRIQVGRASAYIQTQNPADLDEVIGNRKLREYPWKKVSPCVAIVEGEEAARVLEGLRRAGYLPTEAPGARQAEDDLWGLNERGRARSRQASPLMLEPEEQALLRKAVSLQDEVRIQWLQGRSVRSAVVSPFEISDNILFANDIETGEDLSVDLRELRGVIAVEPE